eukprot:SAG31_NODE_4361_length_3311_cov_2.542030_1_plen_76_part_00
MGGTTLNPVLAPEGAAERNIHGGIGVATGVDRHTEPAFQYSEKPEKAIGNCESPCMASALLLYVFFRCACGLCGW